MNDLYEKLITKAKDAASFSYAPYSKISVGAALINGLDEIYTGCNVENASYGLTICAERSAIFNAINHSKIPLIIKNISVCRLDNAPISPCGACRQVIAEFSNKDTEIVYLTEEGMQIKKIYELLPNTFILGE